MEEQSPFEHQIDNSKRDDAIYATLAFLELMQHVSDYKQLNKHYMQKLIQLLRHHLQS